MKFNYFYGAQADQFNFIKIPKMMISDPVFAPLSLTEIMVYAFFLDRMNLSSKNKWFDKEKRVYIVYPITEIQEDLRIGRKKAMEAIANLADFGLIEKKRRGLGQPSLIYVKNFMDAISKNKAKVKETEGPRIEVPDLSGLDGGMEHSETSGRKAQKRDSKQAEVSEKAPQEVSKMELLEVQETTPQEVPKTTLQEVSKSASPEVSELTLPEVSKPVPLISKTENSNTYRSKTYNSQTYSNETEKDKNTESGKISHIDPDNDSKKPDPILSHHINISTSEENKHRDKDSQESDAGWQEKGGNHAWKGTPKTGASDSVCGSETEMQQIKKWRNQIRENIGYDALCAEYRHDRERIDEIVELIVEMILEKKEYVWISSSNHSTETVRERFKGLRFDHIKYAIDCMNANTREVKNIKKYLLAVLFNAPQTIDNYYQAAANHNSPQFARRSG